MGCQPKNRRSYAPLGLFTETSTVPQAYAMGLPYCARCAGWDHALTVPQAYAMGLPYYARCAGWDHAQTVPQAHAMGLPYYARCAGWDHAQAQSVNCADVGHL